jgi:hypothetical protein
MRGVDKQASLRKQREDAHEKKKNATISIQRNGTSWTRLEEADLIRYYTEGHPWDDIGETLRRTPVACRVRVAHLRREGGENITRRSGVSSRHNFKWTVAEDKDLIQLCQEGHDYEYIAEQMERTEDACSVRASMLNVAVVRSAATRMKDLTEVAQLSLGSVEEEKAEDTTIQTTLDDFQTVTSEAPDPVESQPVLSNHMAHFILGAMTMLTGLIAAKYLGV